MKTAQIIKPGNFALLEEKAPEIVKDYKKLKVLACGVCGSDTAIYYKNPPIPIYWPGHEIAVGCDGQTCVVNPVITCNKCGNCKTSRENLCTSIKMISHHLPGGFAENIYVPESNIHKIDASPLNAVLVEPIASSLHAINRAYPTRDANVRIIGGGIIGLLILQILKMQGCKKLSLIAKYPFQQALADKYGSHDFTENPDIIILAVGGDGLAFQNAVDEIQPQGRIVMMGNIYESRPLNLKWLVEREVSVLGSQRYLKTEFLQAINIIESGFLELDSLITHQYPLEDISIAYEAALNKNKNKAVKVIIQPKG